MDTLTRVAHLIASSSALIVLTGAGMGVDAGLPDFRGDGGVYGQGPSSLPVPLPQLMTGAGMFEHPRHFWGAVGALRAAAEAATPHAGFEVLRRWASTREAFALTSNVDEMFQRSGWSHDHIVECHGSIFYLQSSRPGAPEDPIWRAERNPVSWDPESLQTTGPLPTSPYDGEMARPNALLFHDLAWLASRTSVQEERFGAWLEAVANERIALVECGAGDTVPTIRALSHQLLRALPDASLVRINPEPLTSPEGTLEVRMGAAEALQAIDALLG